MTKCFFTGRDARIVNLDNHDGAAITPEGLPKYWITGEVLRAYGSNGEKLNPLEKLNCIKETINLKQEKLIPFWSITKGEGSKEPNIVLRSIEEIKKRPLDHKDKDKKILDLLSQKLTTSLNPFKLTFLNLEDRYSIGVFDDDEYAEWIVHLWKTGAVGLSPEGEALVKDSADRKNFTKLVTNYAATRLTVNGWELARKQNTGWNSKNAFIAMAFTDRSRKPLPSAVRDTLKTTLEGMGWKSHVVDEVEHNDGAMDKVVALINESRFVVSELTHQKTGVYYEAGYAKGKGLPVIHIVEKRELEECHFDVKHLNLIVWDDLSDLAKKLENRIKATIT